MTAQPTWSPTGRVKLIPPTSRDPYYRLEVYDEHGRRLSQTHVGRNYQRALLKAQDSERQLTSGSSQARQACTFGALLDAYLAAGRRQGGRHQGKPWSPQYAIRMGRVTRTTVRPTLGPVPLWQFSPTHVEAVLSRCSSQHQVDEALDVMTGAVKFGVRHRYLRADQTAALCVPAPTFPTSRPARLLTVLQQGENDYLVDVAAVPTHGAVQALARAHPDVAWWELFINTLAYTGIRLAEALVLEADSIDAASSLRPVSVRWQLVEKAGGGLLTPPKNGRIRTSTAPRVTPLGFELWDALCARAEQAQAEQAAGTSPRSLLFPAPRGGYYWGANLRRRLFVPAALEAGWARQTYVTDVKTKTDKGWKTRKATRHQWRHTIHSLRHTYATTARDLWDWDENELCSNGGWASEQFVMARYYGKSERVGKSSANKQEQNEAAYMQRAMLEEEDQ